MHKKALLAVIFASGMINAQLPAVAQSQTHQGTLVERICANNKSTPDLKAYYLLRLAGSYLDGKPGAEIEKEYAYVATTMNVTWADRHWERTLHGLAIEQAVKAENPNHPKLGLEESRLANAAIKKAMDQISISTQQYSQLNLVFAASCLYKRIGDNSGAAECDKMLETSFSNERKSDSVSPSGAKTLISILNARAYGLLPFEIPDSLPVYPLKPGPYTEAQFKGSERIRLEALAIADKLPENEHERRLAHRDLVLWYRALGKDDLAKTQLQILYKLVGFEDEKVLQPQPEGCGSLVWWRQEQKPPMFGCGMG